MATTTAAAVDHRTAGSRLRRSKTTGEPPSPPLSLRRRPPRPTPLADDVGGAPRTVGRTGERRRGVPTAATPPLLIAWTWAHWEVPNHPSAAATAAAIASTCTSTQLQLTFLRGQARAAAPP